MGQEERLRHFGNKKTSNKVDPIQESLTKKLKEEGLVFKKTPNTMMKDLTPEEKARIVDEGSLNTLEKQN